MNDMTLLSLPNSERERESHERLHLVELYELSHLMASNSLVGTEYNLLDISACYNLGSVGSLYSTFQKRQHSLGDCAILLIHEVLCLFIPLILIVRTNKFIHNFN
jgi:hypothetical protein